MQAARCRREHLALGLAVSARSVQVGVSVQGPSLELITLLAVIGFVRTKSPFELRAGVIIFIFMLQGAQGSCSNGTRLRGSQVPCSMLAAGQSWWMAVPKASCLQLSFLWPNSVSWESFCTLSERRATDREPPWQPVTSSGKEVCCRLRYSILDKTVPLPPPCRLICPVPVCPSPLPGPMACSTKPRRSSCHLRNQIIILWSH